ncbi:hypothetical protein [Kineococcus indalonis]|uniref:hypothetical protein n=1 Tax=Kineococcus indalonis TaxID=2696566 RepID=UPI001412C58A|nr:hypothetical protein [Kineococcus indalonis]NAZ86378.1 hypothetical protein [Kineococcus indalonis]
MSLTKSRTQKLAQVREQGTALAEKALAEKVAPAVESARTWATPHVETARTWATPHVESARTWAAPHVESATHHVDTARTWATPHVESARTWAAPHVESATHHVGTAAHKVAPAVGTAAAVAAHKVAPAVDTAREKLTGDLLPRLVEVAHDAADSAKSAATPAVAAAGTAAAAAAAKGASSTKVVRERSADALAVLKGEATVQRAKKKRGRRFLLVLAAVGAGAAVFSAVRSRRQEDPWAAPGAAWTPAAPTNKPTATAAPVPDSPSAGGPAEPAATGTEQPGTSTSTGATPGAGSTAAGATAAGAAGAGEHEGSQPLDLPSEPPSNAVKNFEEATAPVDADDTEGGEKQA